jgi:hypothetical protein
MEQWQSESINELVGAIVKAQLAMVPASKDHVNPYFKSKYADLPSCWEAVACFRDNGVAITQSPMEGPDGFILLDTQLSHTSGQWMRSRLKIRVAKDDPQGYGSAITYARRYALGCMTGLVTEEDDDGNAASTPQGRSHPMSAAASFASHRQTAQAKLAELKQEMQSVVPGASQDSLTTDSAAGAGQPVPAPDNPATPYRRQLAETEPTSKAINAWFRSVPEDLRQEVWADYQQALRDAAKMGKK